MEGKQKQEGKQNKNIHQKIIKYKAMKMFFMHANLSTGTKGKKCGLGMQIKKSHITPIHLPNIVCVFSKKVFLQNCDEMKSNEF